MLRQKIGILGGGQLGKMLCQSGSKLSLDLSILDTSKNFPAGYITKQFTEGNFKNYDDVMAFGEGMDIMTIEIEAVNTEALASLDKMGKKVYPQVEVINTIKDKGLQKEFYEKHNILSSSFRLFENSAEIKAAIASGELKLPFVQKLRRDGYDGRGVQLILKEEDLTTLFDAPSLAEEMVQIEKELSVIVARNPSGQVACYEPVEMIFNPDANLLDYQLAPARITKELAAEATHLATKVAEAFGIVGLLAVELFVNENGEVLVNEVAPRPHNSGHHTIESTPCSQYEQHLRCILDMPLGDTSLIQPSVLLNILGEPDSTGTAKVAGLEECLNLPGVHIHLYGKEVSKPYRKMGHVTVMADNLEAAIEKANFVKENLKITGNG